MTVQISRTRGLFETLRGGLIVSCQALPDEPLHGPAHMAAMARAAAQAGASGIRAQGVEDVRAIASTVQLPIIALIKRPVPGSEVYITPTFEDARALAEAGAAMIALDATIRPRPEPVDELIARIHRELALPVLADVATLDEGLAATRAGADLVGTTLSGYTAETAHRPDEPDYALLSALIAAGVATLLEGRVWTPEQARQGLTLGAHAVVVGSAITRPQEIVRRYVRAMGGACAPCGDRAPGRLALGLDLGGTKILVGLIDERGQVLRHFRYATSTEGGAAGLLAQLVSAVGDTLATLATEERQAVEVLGIATAGMVDTRAGKVVGCTPNLPGWAGTEVAHELVAAHGLPTWVDNDANAAAYGEYWCGAARGVEDFVLLTIGTGLGGGVVCGGRLLRGSGGGAAEIGHTILVPDGLPCNCGQVGCLEAYVSGTALARAAARSGHWGSDAPDSHGVFALAREGDERALRLVREMARWLAVAIISIVNHYDPELVLLGGGVAHQADLFLPMVREAVVPMLGGRNWDTGRIRMAVLGNDAGMVGAAIQSLQQVAEVKRRV